MASLDTTILTDQYSYDVAGNVEEGLTRVDSKGNAALALAKSINLLKKPAKQLILPFGLAVILVWKQSSNN